MVGRAYARGREFDGWGTPLADVTAADWHHPQMALRGMPVVGAEVVIDHLSWTERGIVGHVDETARRVEVTTEDGRALAFALNRATATFTLGGSQTGARLRFAGGR
jgi:RNase P/RNase MRP subunit p29